LDGFISFDGFFKTGEQSFAGSVEIVGGLLLLQDAEAYFEVIHFGSEAFTRAEPHLDLSKVPVGYGEIDLPSDIVRICGCERRGMVEIIFPVLSG
jgi:hypothetical protein